MRLAMGALLLLGTECSAAELPLRFAVTDGWAMPMVQIERVARRREYSLTS